MHVACCAVGVALTAEFTAVGDLFELVIGTVRWPIVIIIGIVSAIYTAYGGLYVSIVTDQVRLCKAAYVSEPHALRKCSQHVLC